MSNLLKGILKLSLVMFIVSHRANAKQHTAEQLPTLKQD